MTIQNNGLDYIQYLREELRVLERNEDGEYKDPETASLVNLILGNIEHILGNHNEY